MRVKELENPQSWLRAGDLILRKGNSYGQKWWGTSLLSLSKANKFKSEVDKVKMLLPQVLDFASEGKVGPNIWKFDV